MKKLLTLVLLACSLPVLAESNAGTNRASAQLRISITVVETLQVQSVTPTADGVEYRGVTNMKSAYLGGQLVTFGKPGAFTVVVPSTTSNDASLFADGPSYVTVASP